MEKNSLASGTFLRTCVCMWLDNTHEKYDKRCMNEPDMEFVQNFKPPDFQAKNFTPSISPNFNSFSKKKHKK